MKLVFSYDLTNNPLEFTLAAARYQKFWHNNERDIVESFHRHTGLKFKQRRITIKIWDKNKSRAGNTGSPMQLSAQVEDPERIAGVLIHELAHRLLIGNGIGPSESKPSSKQRYNYNVHRQVDLFLYDAFVDIMGEAAADEEVRQERSINYSYDAAWSWALSKNYDQRQTALKRLKRRSGMKIK